MGAQGKKHLHFVGLGSQGPSAVSLTSSFPGSHFLAILML